MIPLETRLKNFNDAVSFAADENIQRAMWIHAVPKPSTSIYSVGEFYCQFFDDNDMDDFITSELQESSLSAAQKAAIVEFRDLLDSAGDIALHASCDNGTIVRSKQWKSVVACAKRILPLFKQFQMAATD